MTTARDRKRRIHALLSRWETIRFANSEKECAEDFAAMIVDLEDRLAQYRVLPTLAATPAPLDVERLADALTVLPQTAWDPCMAASVDEVAAAIAAAYAEEDGNAPSR